MTKSVVGGGEGVGQGEGRMTSLVLVAKVTKSVVRGEEGGGVGARGRTKDIIGFLWSLLQTKSVVGGGGGGKQKDEGHNWDSVVPVAKVTKSVVRGRGKGGGRVGQGGRRMKGYV